MTSKCAVTLGVKPGGVCAEDSPTAVASAENTLSFIVAQLRLKIYLEKLKSFLGQLEEPGQDSFIFKAADEGAPPQSISQK